MNEKQMSPEFQGRIKALATGQLAQDQLMPSLACLENRADQHLTFMNYLASLRPQIRSANLPQGINNLVERPWRNAGGHFHCKGEMLIKMKLLTAQLYETIWRCANPRLQQFLR
jgi:transposase-like protein